MLRLAADGLAQYGSDCLTERRLIGGVQNTELLEDEILFEGSENRLNGRWLQQIGCLPLAYPNFAQAGGRMHLAGDRHNDCIRLGEVIRATADNDCWPLLKGCLVRERKPDEDHVPELIRHRKRRLPGCSRSTQRRGRSP